MDLDGRQLLADVVSSAIVGGRGQRQDPHLPARAQRAGESPDLPIRRPEVVTPGADAVGFVDHQQADVQRLEPRQAIQPIELLGSQKQDAQLSSTRPIEGVLVLSLFLIAVYSAGSDVEALRQMIELVAHQGQQRRDDHCDPAECHRSQLVDQRLSVACGLNRQQIGPRQQSLDRLALAGAEAVKTKPVADNVVDFGCGSRCHTNEPYR